MNRNGVWPRYAGPKDEPSTTQERNSPWSSGPVAPWRRHMLLCFCQLFNSWRSHPLLGPYPKAYTAPQLRSLRRAPGRLDHRPDSSHRYGFFSFEAALSHEHLSAAARHHHRRLTPLIFVVHGAAPPFQILPLDDAARLSSVFVVRVAVRLGGSAWLGTAASWWLGGQLVGNRQRAACRSAPATPAWIAAGDARVSRAPRVMRVARWW